MESHNNYGWKKTSKIISFSCPLTTNTAHQTMFLNTTSTLSLNTSRDGDSTTSLDNVFQSLSTLPEKKFYLISNLNLLWYNLRPLPLVLISDTKYRIVFDTHISSSCTVHKNTSEGLMSSFSPSSIG